MAGFALLGAALTALGFGIGADGWGWVVLATFAVTLASGLAVRFGLHRFVGAVLLNVWFLIALSAQFGYTAAHVVSHTWAQTLAWLVGSAFWIAVTFVGWLARGRGDRPQPVPEIPGDTSPRPLTRRLIAFAVLRAFALAVAVAIAWGLDLPNADWLPVATLVAMKPSLDQTTLVAEQRLAGALFGAVIASVLLLTVHHKHALEVITVVVLAAGVAVRAVNYALYCTAIAAGALIAMDIPHPSNLGNEGERVLFTFIGVAIGVVVMLLAGLLARRASDTSQPQTA
jgi:hypothetical protein